MFLLNKSNIVFGLLIFTIPIAYLNVSFIESVYVEPTLLLCASILLGFLFIQYNGQLCVKPFEFASVLLFIIITLKSIFTNQFNVISIAFLCFIIIFYFGISTLFISLNSDSKITLLLKSISFVLVFYICFAFYHIFITKGSIANLYIPNSSIFSILIASQIIFVLPLILKSKSNTTQKFLNYFIIICSVLLLSLTNGRAGWLGFVVALGYIIYNFLNNRNLKKIVLWVSIPLLILVSAGLYFYKANSSSGRVLIYKVASTMLKDNWLLGIGQGQFKVAYNNSQAAYFATHNINSHEALLADNTYYTFNDFYQFIIEHGVMGFVFIITIFYLLYKQIKNACINEDNKPIYIAALASLICIFIGALFSYPLQIFPVIFQSLLCIAILCSLPQKVIRHCALSNYQNNIFKMVLISISIMLSFHYYFLLTYNLKSKDALNLASMGFKTKALEAYNQLSQSYIKDGNINYLYAQQLYYVNRVQDAKVVLAKAQKLYLSHEVYKLSAEIEKELKNYIQAEQDYKIALFMVPNRMVSRKNLLDFYMERKDTANAIYWVKSIINMPVKVRSKTTDVIQNDAKSILNKLIP